MPTNIVLSDESVRQIASEIEPTHRVVSVDPVAKANANDSFILTLKGQTGSESRFVIKRYADHGTDSGARAELEFKVLSLLKAHDVCVGTSVFGQARQDPRCAIHRDAIHSWGGDVDIV